MQHDPRDNFVFSLKFNSENPEIGILALITIFETIIPSFDSTVKFTTKTLCLMIV
jgi:hypothetical protein